MFCKTTAPTPVVVLVLVTPTVKLLFNVLIAPVTVPLPMEEMSVFPKSLSCSAIAPDNVVAVVPSAVLPIAPVTVDATVENVLEPSTLYKYRTFFIIVVIRLISVENESPVATAVTLVHEDAEDASPDVYDGTTFPGVALYVSVPESIAI